MIDELKNENLLRAYETLKICMDGKEKTHQELIKWANKILEMFDLNNSECLDHIVDKYEEMHVFVSFIVATLFPILLLLKVKYLPKFSFDSA